VFAHGLAADLRPAFPKPYRADSTAHIFRMVSMPSPRPPLHPARLLRLSGIALLAVGCTDAPTPDGDAGVSVPAASSPNTIVQHLAAGHPVFGVFSGAMTREQGAAIVETRDADFVLYSMETGPFDVPGMQEYLAGMADGAAARGVTAQPVLLRTPPIHTDAEGTRAQVAEALAAGVDGIVFPHMTSGEEAALSVEFLAGDEAGLWPGVAHGELLDVLIIEDQEGIAHARDIMATPGLSIVFAGPGDLRRAYDGDMEAVENAIQTVLAACKEFDVPCGVTAGVADIAGRLEEGFRVIIVTEPDALAVGRAAAGR